jgi:hypothetical protein
MPSDAETRIQRLLAERRPASAAASSSYGSTGGYRAASSSSYSGYRAAASRPSSAGASAGSYKAGGYSYGTAKYGGSVPASGASRAIGSYTSALASRPVATTLASSSAGTNADDLLSRLREQRAQREARWSGTSAASSAAAKPSYAAPSASKPYVSAYATKPATASVRFRAHFSITFLRFCSRFPLLITHISSRVFAFAHFLTQVLLRFHSRFVHLFGQRVRRRLAAC